MDDSDKASSDNDNDNDGTSLGMIASVVSRFNNRLLLKGEKISIAKLVPIEGVLFIEPHDSEFARTAN